MTQNKTGSSCFLKGESIVGTGQMIAIDVMLLYIVFGPVVLLGIYVLFDSIDPTGKTKKGCIT